MTDVNWDMEKFYPFFEKKYGRFGGVVELKRIVLSEMRYEDRIDALRSTFNVTYTTAVGWITKVRIIEGVAVK